MPYGVHTVTVLALDNNGLATEKTNVFRYYLVTMIPGKIEAEYFTNMSGITTQTTSDTGAGFNVTGITTGDWIDYSLNVEESGEYQVEFRVASAAGGGKLELRKPTGLVLSSKTISATGGSQNWITITDTITLAAGKQTIRLFSVAGGWNINWINFVQVDLTAIRNLQPSENEYSLVISPNPVSSNFTLKYKLSKLSPVEFMLYDCNGKLLGKQRKENIISLSGEFYWKTNSELASGLYYISMQQKGKNLAISKFIKEL